MGIDVTSTTKTIYQNGTFDPIFREKIIEASHQDLRGQRIGELLPCSREIIRSLFLRPLPQRFGQQSIKFERPEASHK